MDKKEKGFTVFYIKKLCTLIVVWVFTGCTTYPGIVVDDFSFDDLPLRTIIVGTLSVTFSAASRAFLALGQVTSVVSGPDNQYIAVSNYFKTYIAQIPSLIVIAELITPNLVRQSVSWSPKDVFGASYFAMPTTTGNAYIYKFNNNSFQELSSATFPVVDPSFPAWSPSGQYLAIGSPSSLTIYRFDGTKVSVVANVNTNSGPPAWSGDGKFVGYVRNDASVYVYSFNGNNLSLVDTKSFTSSSAHCWIKFHPTHNFFATASLNNGGQVQLQLYSYTSVGVATLQQTLNPTLTNGSNNLSLNWSPGGGHIAIGDTTFEFYSFDGSTLTFEQTLGLANFTQENYLTWSPDSRYVVIGLENPNSSGGGINTLTQLYNTGLNPTPSFAEAQAQAPSTLTNIVTSTADQFWAIDGGDLVFSSTEAAITRMRGRWVSAGSQGSLSNPSFSYLFNSSVDGNFYALDQIGKVHQSTSVIVGSTTRINWQVLSHTSSVSPVLVSLYQGLNNFFGIDNNKVIYLYVPSSGWMSVGISPL